MKLLRFLPNILSLLRLLLAIPLAFALSQDNLSLSFMLLVLAGVTDFIDGYLAREFGWRTVLGSWLDPAADKTLITTALITLTLKERLPAWFCFLTVGRDLGLVLGVATLVLRGAPMKIRPYFTGKLVTFAQILVLVFAVREPFWPATKPFFEILIVMTAIMTIWSAMIYGRAFMKVETRQRLEEV